MIAKRSPPSTQPGHGWNKMSCRSLSLDRFIFPLYSTSPPEIFPLMDTLLHNSTFVLFAILLAGLLLGNIRIFGLTLGSSGVLFVALAAGHFGLKVPEGIGGMATALFVYCVGLSVGNRFFSSLRQSGNKLALLSVVVVSLAALVTWGLSSLFGIDPGMAAGMFAGACTSTPGLAAAMEAVPDPGPINIGYGIAYPFGVAGVVLFVQLLPRFLKANVAQDDIAAEQSARDPKKIISRLVLVTNEQLAGYRVAGHHAADHLRCRITRVVRNGRLVPITADDKFTVGEELLMVGAREDVEREALMIGELRDNNYPTNSEREKSQVIALSKKFCGHTLRNLHTLQKYGVVVSRISRLGFSFVPTADTEIIRNDILTVVGDPSGIESFKKAVGHRSTAIRATDMLSLVGGIAFGILLGNLQFSLGNGASFSLGMAGGPLVVALILGHFGHIGPIVGYIPRETRTLLMELGLILFLAWAGVAGGAKLVATLQSHGLTIFLIGAAITAVPLIAGYFFATKVLKLQLLEALGGICGSMTSTPALGAITSKTDVHTPVVSYATAYPAALILMTVFAKAIVSSLS